ncbi:MAG TPA: CinA family protein [Oscillospiraceae bacterium]|nr:CinA family protein [Oscillospiraceae bacterium]HPF55205.1 CinA family protein [Clostridiales bacterium]HPK36411.1 CinA family protein [Oscillospiraceae bacterium]HPR75715.1 CinA family protein [Oscillospiraceae bacterium]
MEKIAEQLVTLLKEKGLKISAAESCTGGLFCKLLTDVPGCSAVLDLSAVTYANAAKTALLDVPKEILETEGAVSADCATEMVRGILRLSGADIGVAITGIAGPGGGSAEKPVGTVFIAAGTSGRIWVKKFNFDSKNAREQIRISAANAALEMAVKLINSL